MVVADWISPDLDVEVQTATGEWVPARTISGVERPHRLLIVWVTFPWLTPRAWRPGGGPAWENRTPWPIEYVRVPEDDAMGIATEAGGV